MKCQPLTLFRKPTTEARSTSKVSLSLTFATQKQLTERKVYFAHGGFGPQWHKGNIEQFTSRQLGGREEEKQQGKKRLFQDMPVRIHSQ